MARSGKLKKPNLTGQIESMTLEGDGVCRVDGKVYFVDGALPGEQVEFEVQRNRKKHGQGKLINLLQASDTSGRVEPDCEYFGVCGGCSLRHFQTDLQLESKQSSLLDAYKHIGRVEPEMVNPPIAGDWLHYRRKARLGIRYVDKKGGALVGFREKNASYITPLNQCLTLTKPISDLLPDLAVLINQLSIYNKVPQIEVAHGDNQISLVFRHLEPFNEEDKEFISEFSKKHNIQSYLQSGGLKTVQPIYPIEPETLFYNLEKFGFRFFFSATDFVQVNSEANQLLIDKAMQLLDPQPEDKLLDLYCGLGNFSLPIASLSDSVVGIEGDQRLVDLAKSNARYNQVENVEFIKQDLTDESADFSWLNQDFNKALLDPARSGARLMCEKLANMNIPRIVYVSCNPATLARDAGELVNTHGYRLIQTGIINMFPHTAHVESIALFEKEV